MKRSCLLLVLFTLLVGCTQLIVSSPDASLCVSFRLAEGGSPQYCVMQDQDTVLDWSRMGLECAEQDLRCGFTKTRCIRRACDETWETVWGEERLITDKHNE